MVRGAHWRARAGRMRGLRCLRHGVCHVAVVPHAEARMSDLPYRVEKPWGYEVIWARTDRYVGKILHIEPGHVLSLQYHHKKDESIYVLSGEIILRIQQGDTLIERHMPEGA